VVIMDFMAQLQAHLMSHQYEGLMKKPTCAATAGPARCVERPAATESDP
jgi:preprotein translocase subunit SecY